MYVAFSLKINKILERIEHTQCEESIIDQKIYKLFSKIPAEELFKSECISLCEMLQRKMLDKSYETISEKLLETIKRLREKKIYDRMSTTFASPETFPLKNSIGYREKVSNVTFINQLSFDHPMSCFFKEVIDDRTPCIVFFDFMRYHVLHFKNPDNWLFFTIKNNHLSCYCLKVIILKTLNIYLLWVITGNN